MRQFSVITSLDLLRRDEVRSALDAWFHAAQLAALPQIKHLHLFFRRDHDVVRFCICVNVAALVDGSQTVGNLDKHLDEETQISSFSAIQRSM